MANLEHHRVRRVPLGENLVFFFESTEPSPAGDLACTLLLEGEASDEAIANRWMDISRHIYLRTPTNQVIRAYQISASVLDGRTSPVQRLIFDCEGQVPVSIGCDDPTLMLEVYFPSEVLRALSDDLGGNRGTHVDFAL